MDDLNICFIGGCINKQKGMERRYLFHNILKHIHQRNNQVNNIKISLGFYPSYNKLYTQTQEVIIKSKPEVIFVFIRPFPLLPLHKPFVKYDLKNGRKQRTLHPAFISRKLKWDSKLTDYQDNENPEHIQKGRFGLRDINLIAGVFSGLHSWAMQYLFYQIEKLKTLSTVNKTELVIISPPKNPESIMGNIICKWTAYDFKKYCNKNHIHFIDVNSFPISDFENDGIHFNLSGHKRLANSISLKLLEIKKAPH